MQFVFFLGVDALSRERLLRTIFFYSGHLQHECERSDMERNYVTNNKAQQWNELELTTLVSEVSGGTKVQSKQAHVLQYKNL